VVKTCGLKIEGKKLMEGDVLMIDPTPSYLEAFLLLAGIQIHLNCGCTFN
jgi:hypothetical protein